MLTALIFWWSLVDIFVVFSRRNGANYGVDIDNDGICDTFAKYVWEPATSKVNSYSSATEAATLVLSVDETVRNPQVCITFIDSVAHLSCCLVVGQL